MLRHERTFNAPRALVWEVLTKPEHIRKWYGPRGTELTVCDVDFRVGGKYRYAMKSEHGEFGYNGEYKEIIVPEKVVNTWIFEMMPDHPTLETMELEDLGDKTHLRMSSDFGSPENLQGWASSGGEAGMMETYERLEELLAELQK